MKSCPSLKVSLQLDQSEKRKKDFFHEQYMFHQKNKETEL